MILTIGCPHCANELEQIAGTANTDPMHCRAVLACRECGAQHHLIASLQAVRQPSANADRTRRIRPVG